MLLINNTCTNAYFNLAMEEYFLKNCNEDIFLLWRNENAIIVGKNQNTLSEINYDYVKNNNIKEGDKKETFYNEKAENRQRLQLNRTHHCYCNHGRTGCRMCPHVYQIYP